MVLDAHVSATIAQCLPCRRRAVADTTHVCGRVLAHRRVRRRCRLALPTPRAVYRGAANGTPIRVSHHLLPGEDRLGVLVPAVRLLPVKKVALPCVTLPYFFPVAWRWVRT